MTPLGLGGPVYVAVRAGASSRAKERPMMRPVYSMPPNFWRPKANCTAMTMPTKTAVTLARPAERTPIISI